jgi:hypothetical protein
VEEKYGRITVTAIVHSKRDSLRDFEIDTLYRIDANVLHQWNSLVGDSSPYENREQGEHEQQHSEAREDPRRGFFTRRRH